MGRSPDELPLLAASYRLSQLIHACAALGVPDALASGASSAAEIAAVIDAPTATTSRLLRAAASEGVIDGDGRRYALNDFSERLRSDVADSWRDMVLGWWVLPSSFVAFSRLDDVVRTGHSGYELALGARFHDYMRTDATAAARYEAAMESTIESFRGQAQAYDFTAHPRVVDVGGGQGSFLVAILQAHPTVEATLFDLPDVVKHAPARLAQYPQGPQVDIVGGDMFTDLPSDRDVYLFSTVLRCFTDDECLPVLELCRQRMAPGGRVLAVEMVLQDGVPPPPRALADLQALVVYGGIDRTEAEWTALFARAGFAPPTFTPVEGPFVFVEAVADR